MTMAEFLLFGSTVFLHPRFDVNETVGECGVNSLTWQNHPSLIQQSTTSHQKQTTITLTSAELNINIQTLLCRVTSVSWVVAVLTFPALIVAHL